MQRKARISFETAPAQKAASNPKEFFGHLQRGFRLRTQITTLKDSNSDPITDLTSEAVVFGDRFREIHRLDTSKPTPPIHRDAHSMPPLQIETAVVQHALASLNPHKGQGPVSLHPAVLEAIPTLVAQPLTDLFNPSLVSAELPDDWRSAILCPTFKTVAREDPGK